MLPAKAVRWRWQWFQQSRASRAGQALLLVEMTSTLLGNIETCTNFWMISKLKGLVQQLLYKLYFHLYSWGSNFRSVTTCQLITSHLVDEETMRQICNLAMEFPPSICTRCRCVVLKVISNVFSVFFSNSKNGRLIDGEEFWPSREPALESDWVVAMSLDETMSS